MLFPIIRGKSQNIHSNLCQKIFNNFRLSGNSVWLGIFTGLLFMNKTVREVNYRTWNYVTRSCQLMNFLSYKSSTRQNILLLQNQFLLLKFYLKMKLITDFLNSTSWQYFSNYFFCIVCSDNIYDIINS